MLNSCVYRFKELRKQEFWLTKYCYSNTSNVAKANIVATNVAKHVSKKLPNVMCKKCLALKSVRYEVLRSYSKMLLGSKKILLMQ